ncbi:SDR family NAD(P)-dependent oxidoreductase [Stieleria varia]|uniref:Putative oxidoreductase n=1 Tax=Stieleria varia TaxID=2528005 RepID=A0A5C6ANP9_9BACT|nr:SDR family oxidoreductase [Stieleria varia]TWU00879.1 putative oxidoreductase [Stieleria varia]
MNASPSPLPTAIITGGSAGLGRVIAETFLQRGYRVMIVGRNETRLQRASQTINHPELHTAQCDLLNTEQTQSLADRVQRELGRLDVLVNCVGASDRSLVSELTPDRLHELIDQNVVTMLLCSQSMAGLLEQSSGTIVNIGSLAGKVGARYLGGYNAAKHALTGLTQQMRLEMLPKNIHVAIVHPGPIRRDDAGARYDDRVSTSMPAQAAQPGGGTSVKGLDPQRVADAVLRCVERKKRDIILPAHMRWMIALGNAFPSLGDWLLLKFTSKRGE